MSDLNLSKNKKPLNHLNYLYWTKKGYSLEEAKEKIKEFSIKGAKSFIKDKENNPEKYEGFTSSQLKYWLDKGYNEEEAEEKLRERQRTFSLDICIERYGEEKGKQVFEERQRKWQETLNSKSEEELADINRAKDTLDYYRFVRKGYSIEESKEMLIEYFKKRGFDYKVNKEDCKKYFVDLFEKNPSLYLSRIHVVYKKLYRKYLFILWDDRAYDKEKFQDVFEEYMIEWVGFQKYDGEFKVKKTGIGHHIWVGEYTFRSFNEFNFYVLLKNMGIDFEVEKMYNDSLMRCDFYLPKWDMYIEIAGMIDYKDYNEKMRYKQEKYGSILIEAGNIVSMKKRLLEEIAKSEHNG